MQIDIHGFVASIHGMIQADIVEMFNILGVSMELCITNAIGTSKEYTHSFKEVMSLYIRANSTGYVLLNLHGSFFDNSPEFRLRQLLRFLSRFQHTFKQLDVGYNDDLKCMTKKVILFWFRNKNDYITGSLARYKFKNLYSQRKFDCIQLGSAKSTTNFRTIYVRPETGFIRFEIKFKNIDKIKYILKDYSTKNPEQFHTRSIESLVSCINIVTAQSKKNRVVSKYKKQPAWAAFLASDIKRISWSKIRAEQLQNRINSDEATFGKSVRRNANMIINMIKRLSTIHPEAEVLKQFAAHAGYKLVKDDTLE